MLTARQSCARCSCSRSSPTTSLDWLCREGHVELHRAGWVYREGEPATCFYVLLDGERRAVLGGSAGTTSRSAARPRRGVYAGAWQAYLGDRVPQVYNNSMRVTEPSRFFVLAAETFAELMREWFPMAMHLLEGLFFGMQSTQQAVGQRERLLALGSLSAGLTHELNNPAAAAVRATSSLRDRVAGMRHKLGADRRRPVRPGHPRDADPAAGGRRRARRQGAEPDADGGVRSRGPSSATGSTRTDIAGGWDLAPTFVQAGLDVDWLDQVAATVDEPTLEGAIRWLNYTVETELLMNEIEDSTTRISTLVGAAKQYSQMDRAPYQVVDVHELLDSTLLMLSRKIGDGIKVVKDYDRTLPPIPAYAAELNQVWTNLIDNAIAAMDGVGTLTVRTVRDEDNVRRRDRRHRAGCAARRFATRIFEPFFTTKPFGEGTGLGLDISWRIVVNKHHGDLSVESVPGDTRFRVRLPLRPGARRADPRRAPTRTERMTDDAGIDPTVPPSGTGCVECLAADGWWFHLRRCAQCGHIGCCDTSPSQHATAHAKATGHPMIRSFEPGEELVLGLPDRAVCTTARHWRRAGAATRSTSRRLVRRAGARRLAASPALRRRDGVPRLSGQAADARLVARQATAYGWSSRSPVHRLAAASAARSACSSSRGVAVRMKAEGSTTSG